MPGVISRTRVAALFAATVLLLVVACSGADVGQEVGLPELSYEGYLASEIDPCTPIEGSGIEPCGAAPEWEDQGPPYFNLLESETPRTMESYLTGLYQTTDTGPDSWAAHLVIRGTYLPDTVRCTVQHARETPIRFSDGTSSIDNEQTSYIHCFADVRVNEYFVGTGPSKVSVMVFRYRENALPSQEDRVEEIRLMFERQILNGPQDYGYYRLDYMVAGGLPGREFILFLGPATNFTFMTFRVYAYWDLEKRSDGTVIAAHPHRDTFAGAENYATQWRPLVEMTLPDFERSVQAAHTARVALHGGRIGAAVDLPMLITDAHKLAAFHTQAGNLSHADGAPIGAPAPCGLAVTNQLATPKLMQDCIALLRGLDQLRGTATLNWSAETAIESWEGITLGRAAIPSEGGAVGQARGKPNQVTKVELANKGLTGSVPEALEKLEITTLKLSGNTLTGCIPPELGGVATNDLAQLNLLYCGPAKPSLTVGTPAETSIPLTWAAVADTSAYRVEYKAEYSVDQSTTWTEASSTIATTSYTVTGLTCGTPYRFRLSAYGSGATVAAAWSDPSVSVGAQTIRCVPEFTEESYAFRIPEWRPVGHFVMRTTATDPNGDSVTYRITSGNDDGLFTIEATTGAVLLAKTLDYETTTSYTLTVEARDGNGGVGRTTVTITVTDVAE